MDECIEHYATLSKIVFKNERISLWGIMRARYDAKILQKVIVDVLKKIPKTDSNGIRCLNECVNMSEATLLDNTEQTCKA